MNREEFVKFHEGVRTDLLFDHIFVVDALDAFDFSEYIFDDNFFHREVKHIVPVDSVYDAVVNFVDYSWTEEPCKFKRAVVSIHNLENYDDMVEVKIAVGYITF